MLKKISIILCLALFISILHFEANAEPGYSHLNSKGNRYYLYTKEVPLKDSAETRAIYFFAKSPDNKKGTALMEVPSDRIVSETKNGLLVLKKKPVDPVELEVEK